VLRPLADIAPQARVPGQGTVADLLAHVDSSRCIPLDAAS
jgi:7,8-dihydro-6-hydroxymethylpterin-pyrophosphokinase